MIDSVEELEDWLEQQQAEAADAAYRAEYLAEDKYAAAWHRGYIAAMKAVHGQTGYINHVGFGVDIGGHCPSCDDDFCDGVEY